MELIVILFLRLCLHGIQPQPLLGTCILIGLTLQDCDRCVVLLFQPCSLLLVVLDLFGHVLNSLLKDSSALLCLVTAGVNTRLDT